MAREKLIPEISEKARNYVNNYLASGTATPQNNVVFGQSSAAANWAGSTPKAQKTVESAGNEGGFDISSVLSIMNGATGLVNNFNQLNDIADTSYQQNLIDQIGGVGRYEVNSFDQINDQFNQLNMYQPDLDLDTIRGGSKQERIGNVLSSVATGAATGAQVGGLWGGIAGAAVGLGTGIGGWLMGDQKADDEQKRLKMEQGIAMDNATKNINARMENLADYKFRNAVPRMRADGGMIERKSTSLKDFADSVLNKKKANDTTRSAGIVRQHCKGGTMIRIKR